MKINNFQFEVLNKVVPISSIKKDFPKSICDGIKGMAERGEIVKQGCYENAYKVARFLIQQGYDNVRLVDGTYRCLRQTGFIDTHRFIQCTLPNGVNRYYDATIEFVSIHPMLGLYSFEYKAIRIIDVSEVERYNTLVDKDKIIHYGCMMSTLDYNEYDKRDVFDYRRVAPYITDDGVFVSGSTHACNMFGYTMTELKAWQKRMMAK